jgi:hypothetical protein
MADEELKPMLTPSVDRLMRRGGSLDDRLGRLGVLLAAVSDLGSAITVRAGIVALIADTREAGDRELRRRAEELRRQANICDW